jgi:hypothetical protein
MTQTCVLFSHFGRAPVVTRGGDRRELGAPTETGELIGVKKDESDAEES